MDIFFIVLFLFAGIGFIFTTYKAYKAFAKFVIEFSDFRKTKKENMEKFLSSCDFRGDYKSSNHFFRLIPCNESSYYKIGELEPVFKRMEWIRNNMNGTIGFKMKNNYIELYIANEVESRAYELFCAGEDK